MTASEKKMQYIENYNRNHYVQVKFRVSQESRLYDLITIAAKRQGKSMSQYITEAIQKQLSYDGITFDDLEMDDNNSVSDKKD